MDYKKLNIIDFSQGIKSKEVMENDISLQEQMYRERLVIAGSGINYGITLTMSSDFTVSISEGTLINNNGEEVYVKGGSVDLEPPAITLTTDERVYPTEDGKIVLSDIPYSLNRLEPSQYSPSSEWGIYLRYEDNAANVINISNIYGNILYTDATDLNRPILATYYISKDRIDTIYMKNDYSIDIAMGTSSTTPSIYNPDVTDCLYVLGYVRIDHDTYDEDKGHVAAKCTVIDEYNNRRTVYTDSENNLYLCGMPFYGFSVIYYKEPKNPKEGAMWYDSVSNKFMVWRRTDDFIYNDTYTFTSIDPNDPQHFETSTGYFKNQLKVYISASDDSWIELKDYEIEYYTDLQESQKDIEESYQFRVIPKVARYTKVRYTINKYDGSFYWVPVNDTSFIQVSETKMWTSNLEGDNFVEYMPGISIEDMPIDRPHHDFKTFMFKNTENHLKFTPHKNEISIMIDQIPLHKDQFTEITVDDILNNTELTVMAYSYGYNAELLKDMQTNDKEVGLGFKLQSALDRPAFVEVNITHRVNDSFLKNKFQRAATFNKIETIVYDSATNPAINNLVTIDTVIPYQYDEGQLEVYINGLLINSKYIEEITNTTPALIGAYCNSFKLKAQETGLATGSEITYKITTNIYNYNHVESYLEDYLLNHSLPTGSIMSLNEPISEPDMTNVIDDLDSTSTTNPLSANQGRVLNDKITQQLNGFTISVLSQAEYDLILVKDSNTLYFIKEE